MYHAVIWNWQYQRVFPRNHRIAWVEKAHLNLYRPSMGTLPETNIFAPENGWLEYEPFPLGPGLFSGAMLVSGTVVY